MFQPKSFQISRRSFIAKCAATAVATGLPFWVAERAVMAAEEAAVNAPTQPSPNDRPGIGWVGCGGQGNGDARSAARFGEILAVADVDQSHADRASRQFTRNGKKPEAYGDFRKLMERDDIHIIVQACPDHWHTLVNLAAAKAKKDIYGEKPLTLTIDEGKHVVKAVRDNKTIFQTGTQQRSSQRFHTACELVRNGRIGKVTEVDVWVPAGLRAGPFHSIDVPQELNWDFWLGQAPKVDYERERCHGTFRWWFDYAGGPVTDWGAHHNDIVRWGLGLDGPLDVETKVITPAISGGYTAPSEYEATLNWANGVKQIVRTTKDDSWTGGVINPNGQRNGVKFIGTDGWIWVNRADLSASKDEIIDTPLPDNAIHLENSGDHMGNFMDCVRSRKDPISNIEEGHRSAIIGHLIIISMQLGRKFQWDPVKEVFVGDGANEANARLAREMRKPYDYSFVA